MSALDWTVLLATTLAIVVYGIWRTHNVRDATTYLAGDSTLRWPTIGLSIMATQASAITFISTPAQGFSDGMRFVQFYFGLPLAMIVISAVFVPVYYKLKVRTAYEYLEHRFDVRVRYFAGLLFLIGRGLAAGITLYAPAIVLTQILGWPLQPTIWGIGVVTIVYTVIGGTTAVSITQKHQMVVMLTGLVVAAIVVIARLPDGVSLGGAVKLAGALGRMNAVSFDLDFENRYNFWSGLAGGFFLALSYFGTDQSQVQRYLTGRSVAESRLGLLFNGLVKVPMQFLILFTGVMVFVFYLFTQPPLHFDTPTLRRVAEARPAQVAALEARFDTAFADERAAALRFNTSGATADRDALRAAAGRIDAVRADAKKLIHDTLPSAETRDNDFVFLSFVLDHMPIGVIGLLIAVIMCAAMSGVSSELIALGTTSAVDFYLRMRPRASSPERDLRISKLATFAWGLLVIGFASACSLFANLIEAVNILGSIFYGTILGIFVVALFLRRVTALPVLIGAAVAQAAVVGLFVWSDLGFLWFNVIGCGLVVVVSLVVQLGLRQPRHPSRPMEVST
jgi:solute:Na+ symporter, SSS family